MYNATIFRVHEDKVIGAFVAEVDSAGKMLRSNSLQFTGLEGSPEYDDMFRRRTSDALYPVMGKQHYSNVFSNGMPSLEWVQKNSIKPIA